MRNRPADAKRLRLLGATSFLVLALTVPAVPSASADPASGDRASADPGAEKSWIVTLTPGADAAHDAPGLVAQQGGQLLHVYDHVLNGFSFTGSAAAADALARNPRVVAVEENRPVHTVELAPYGILRIDSWAAHGAGYDGRTADGTSVRVAVVDTGIDLDHPDLQPNLSPGEGKNCITPGALPNDDHGHGSHVAGTVGAPFNGTGVVGVATNVKLVPVKVIAANGSGTDAQVICGLDYVATLPGPVVVNMSLGEGGRPGETACSSSALHQAVCNLTSRGVTVVAAAGNDGADAAGFVPAAFPESIAVSALADFDGTRSFSGCRSDFLEYGYQCDDMLADFSNYGSVVDVAAPGVWILSAWNNGGHQTSSGTSMASPHVAGTAALILGANPTLSPNEVRSVLQNTGECPDGTVANAATCAGHGQWQVGSLFGNTSDRDGIPEPLVNALRAAQAAGDTAPPPPPPPTDTDPPTVALTSPSGGTVSGTVTLAADAADAGSGVVSVAFAVDGTTVGTDTTAPYSFSWNTATVGNGSHTITARATDGAGNAATSVPVVVDVQNVVPVASMHITRLTGWADVAPRWWRTWVDVEVVNEAGAPVAGATVTFAVSGGATTTRTCTTGSNGRCSTSNQKIRLTNSQSSITYVTSNVSKSGVTWDGVMWGVTLVRPTAKGAAAQSSATPGSVIPSTP